LPSWRSRRILVASIAFVWRHRHRLDALPPAVVTAVEHERADRARVDSQLIAASLEAVAAQQRQAVAEARAEQLRSIARRFSDYADSLARKAELARTAQDSASYYRSAYLVRTDERDTLLHALAEKDTALQAAESRAASFRRALVVADSARQRADSVLDATVHAVRVAECRVPLTFGLVHCMSRTHAALVGVGLGVGGKMAYDAVRDGRLKIPLPFLHR
jgi:hypothetical protein